jgi:hypothetical protein
MTSPSRPYTERKAEVDSFVRAMATIWAEMPVDTRTREDRIAALDTQRVPCPECGINVNMSASWDGSRPDEALCNTCHDTAEADGDGTSGQDRESYSDDQDRDSYTIA